MASLCQKVRSANPPKYKTRRVNRCGICGRARAYMRKFMICRCCFRSMASQGLIPGMTKASW